MLFGLVLQNLKIWIYIRCFINYSYFHA